MAGVNKLKAWLVLNLAALVVYWNFVGVWIVKFNWSVANPIRLFRKITPHYNLRISIYASKIFPNCHKL